MKLSKFRTVIVPVILTIVLSAILSACYAHNRPYRGHYGQFGGHQSDHHHRR